MASARNDKLHLFSASTILILIAVIKLLLHLFASRKYGYFVDELYYLACSDHLAWGYVDQPSLIAAIAKIEHTALGDSLQAIRLLPALAGAGIVLLTGAFARQLGAGRFGQALAALGVLVAPWFLAFDSFLSMNAFEPLFWTGCAYIFVLIAKNGNQRLWLLFGLVAGVGLHNKYSMLFFASALLIGLLLTPLRSCFRQRAIWLGMLIAFLIFLPNLIWNIQHHFPFLELQNNIRHSGRNVSLTTGAFLGQQIGAMLFLTFPVWLAGLCYYLFSRRAADFRALGWTYLIMLGAFTVLKARTYYLAPAYPMLLAAGGTAWESYLTNSFSRWIKGAYAVLILLVGAILAPSAAPILPVETYIRYSQTLHLQPPRIETWKIGPLPQFYADQFGWEEMVIKTAEVYKSLPPDVRARTAIFGWNFGQAGAIDLFGNKWGLPKAISGHQNYFLWGPRGYSGESVIVLGGASREGLLKYFNSVEKVGTVYHPYSMPYEHFDIYYCRWSKHPLDEMWTVFKRWN